MSNQATNQNFELRYYETIRRESMAPAIGRTAVDGASEEIANLRKRRRTELQSTLAEGLKPEQVRSVIDTHYVIETKDDKLIAEDGEPIENMLARALQADEILASEDEFFEPFLVKQTQSEIDELREWEAMVDGETAHNTLITFSGYRIESDDGTPEAHQKLIRAGKKPYWRRGMFRVAHAENGALHVFNYSIDNCSNELMAEAARRELGYEFEASDSTDMQAERVRRRIDDDSWRFLAPRLVTAGDSFLAQKHGGAWKHGYDIESDVRRAQSFVESQTQIVDSLIKIDERLANKHSTFESYSAEFETELYNCLALLELRLSAGKETEPVVDYGAASSTAGDVARSEGRSYDACGVLISANNSTNQSTAGNRTGFESLLRLENKKIPCYSCKQQVVVDKGYLNKGELRCGKCGYHIDACTGKVINRGRRSQAKEPKSAWEQFSESIAVFNRNYEIERAKKQAKEQNKAA